MTKCDYCKQTSITNKRLIENNRILAEKLEKMRIKNAGFYRQLFGEMLDDRTFTSKELWEIFDEYAPLLTEEQKKELREVLKR